MAKTDKFFHIHGDNIVECLRVLHYIVSGLEDLVCNVAGPETSVTCPVYTVELADTKLQFQFLPGYGGHRWNQDILTFVKHSGGRLREAADAIVSLIDHDRQVPIAAIEFCGALPAGNQAWQRHGRAFSFAHAGIPYFYVAELGGFELGGDRGRKATRMPNPAIPFSFVAMTEYTGSVCLPVYEANSGATSDTIDLYESIFGMSDFVEFLKSAILGRSTGGVTRALSGKSVALVKRLADTKKRKDGLTGNQWQSAYDAILAGDNLPNFLYTNAQISWKKTAYIAGLTETARQFMELGRRNCLGLTSSSLPLSFVPGDKRAAFSKLVRGTYPDMSPAFANWLSKEDTHLAIAWVMGFKPRGDDARPDRGLPPLARMLVGEECDLLTFVYGPAPEVHWTELAENPRDLAGRNGLWEAILGISDGVLIDSVTKPADTPRGYLKESWDTAMVESREALRVEAKVRRLGEQDADAALHVAFEALGTDSVFEGMCNPPGGDWSGISFRWGSRETEYRWLTLPRVSAVGAKRPDHVFAVFGHGANTVCLCIESKERAQALEANIGTRLTRYTQELFRSSPSIARRNSTDQWTIYSKSWQPNELQYVSAGAYLSDTSDPFRGLPKNTALDIQIGISFSSNGNACNLHMRGDTELGQALVTHLVDLRGWGMLATAEINN